MRTPVEYVRNFNNGIITNEMLESAIFTYNKRAKNCRDRQLERMADREYRQDMGMRNYDKYHNEQKYRNEKLKYYNKKAELLKLVKPSAIHLIIHENGKKTYFLFYQFKNHSFHSPISKERMKRMEDLPIVTLDDLVTEGKDVNDLLSVQFADKLLALVRSGNYKLVD